MKNMKPLMGSKDEWGNVHCYVIKFHYINKDKFEYDERFEDQLTDAVLDDTEIIGFPAEYVPKCIHITLDDLKIAVTNPPENYPHDYRLIIGNLRTKAADFDKIRRSEKPVIAICDFDFLDDVEQYIAAGAQVIVFNKLRKKNG